MQKLINVIALLSGVVSLSVVGAGGYLYVNKDALIEDVREKASIAITSAIKESLPGMLGGGLPEVPAASVPELPTSTGPAVPSVPGF